MATFKIRTRNTDQDQWTDRYEVDKPILSLNLDSLTAPCVQTLVDAGENQIECVNELGQRQFYIEKLA